MYCVWMLGSIPLLNFLLLMFELCMIIWLFNVKWYSEHVSLDCRHCNQEACPQLTWKPSHVWPKVSRCTLKDMCLGLLRVLMTLSCQRHSSCWSWCRHLSFKRIVCTLFYSDSCGGLLNPCVFICKWIYCLLNIEMTILLFVLLCCLL